MANHGKHYSDNGFWDKISDAAKAAGRQGLEKAFLLYNVMIDAETPAAAKAIVAAALGYFIFPIDAIPDVLVGVGYTDDIAVMAGAIKAIADHVTPAHKKEAKKAVKEWLA